MNTRVINFCGGPGAGKSTLAGELFGWMKRRRVNCEYVSEFAKDLTWRGDHVSLDDQIFVTATQHNRIYTLLNQVEYIITDSPIFLGLFYVGDGYKKFDIEYPDDVHYAFDKLVNALYAQYSNINFLVDRNDREYIEAGRNQTEEEAKIIDNEVEKLLIQNGFPYTKVSSLDEVLQRLVFD